jgi:hypothetical protein
VADFVAKLDDKPLSRNYRILAHKVLNQHCALAPAVESILLVLAQKIVLQQYRPTTPFSSMHKASVAIGGPADIRRAGRLWDSKLMTLSDIKRFWCMLRDGHGMRLLDDDRQTKTLDAT